MKLFATILLYFFITPYIYSQNWHAATDTLKLPVSKNNAQVALAYNNRFDTVECRIKIVGSEVVQKGFKYVFVLEGFYIDFPNTVNVFFDEKKQRIMNVQKFYFN